MAEDKSLDDILMSSEDLIAQEKLDSGGYGLVSLCKHRIHGLVVLKTVYTGFKNPMYNDKLLEEGKIMHMLKNDRVVKLLGLILEEGNYSLVMEYLRNGNLMTILHKVFVPMSIKARFIMEIIEGMTYLHDQNVIHKDVKPQNILADENFHIKIADLGVATFKKWSTLTKEEINRQRKYPNKSTDSTRKSNAGTLIYMAPEHLKSLNVKSTEKSDVYSFAIVIWVILMDKEPYENAHNEDHISFCVTRNDRPDMEDLPDDCPEAIELMVKCWEDNPEERPTFNS
ncbi:hypothetical protein GDO86_011300 [Hymenochirus boettgeri]|uniref:Protein kinase domain-containing protein n=1 Tax=Hymenochirus boettgeri TaxID=247094 RepID=A0A8T2JJ03_9PIPI|nr:hypothetical protein GDO86_011300 [Hymenochirus boettgeri]